MPDFIQPSAAAPPSYEQLLAQAKMKMLGPGMPAVPSDPWMSNPVEGPTSFGDIGLFSGGGEDDRLANMPPGMRRAFDRLPPDLQERMLSMWGNRGDGGMAGGGQQGMFGGLGQPSGGPGGGMAGARNNAPPGGPDWEGSFKDWAKTSVKGILGVTNPFSGLAMAGKGLYDDYRGGRDFTEPSVTAGMQHGGFGRPGGVGLPGVGGGFSLGGGDRTGGGGDLGKGVSPSDAPGTPF